MGHLNHWRLPAAALASAALLAGCGGGGTDEGVVNGVQFKVNSPAEIAQTSAENYDDNVNGLISGATLKRWIADWTGQRPAGITGKLVVLQASAGPAGAEYVKSNGSSVFTYLSPSSEWTQTRANGVITTQSMVPDGAAMDALLAKYNIDPSRDMIVAAMGNGSTANSMAQGRIWYALRYWGVDKAHIALLNGGNQWLNGNPMTAADFQPAPDTAPGTGTFSVKRLLVDNTQLQATLEDMLRILPSSDVNVKTDGVLLWDARNLGQYSAGMMVERGEDTDSNTAGTQACASAYCNPVDTNNYMWTFQNQGSRQGHPFGALQLQFTRLLDATRGFAYKPKAALLAYLNGETDADGMGFVSGNYSPVGAGNAYQEGDTIYTYCETTFRAMVTGVATAVILGKPTRFYDGAMVEWNSLSNLRDSAGNFILPADSPWRTDGNSYSRPATASSLVGPRTIGNPYAGSANAIVNADKAYKTGESPVAGGGGGGGLPGNPCGG